MATQAKTRGRKSNAEQKPKTARKAEAKRQHSGHFPGRAAALIVAAVLGVGAGLVLLARRFSHRAAAAS